MPPLQLLNLPVHLQYLKCSKYALHISCMMIGIVCSSTVNIEDVQNACAIDGSLTGELDTVLNACGYYLLFLFTSSISSDITLA